MTPPRLRRLLGIVPAVALLSCHIEEPFVRDNHWDPGSTATKTLTGPDSTYSLGAHFTLTLTGDPPLPPGPLQVTWVGAGSVVIQTEVLPAGYGEFVVTKAHAGYELLTVGVTFGETSVSHQIWVGQLVDALDLSCSGAFGPSCDAAPLTIGATLSVASDMRDANTNTVGRRNVAMARSTYVSRDPSVLSVAPTTPNVNGTYTVQGVSAGSTWLVVTADRARDSVRVVVSP